MTTTLTVSLVRTIDESYPIVVGRNLTDEFANFVATSSYFSRRIALLTDSNLPSLVAHPLAEALRARGLACEVFTFPAGEVNKVRSTKEALEDALVEQGYGRDTLILAVGGGVVTDLAGFVAATFTRGVPYISFSTTLLGAADASVGGKTAVDTPAATNLIGAFHQPSAVFIDVEHWATLSNAQIRDGLGETVKHACLADSAFFELLEDAFVRRRLSLGECVREGELAEYIARRNCEIKRDFVVSDVHEGNRRMGLNLGHTIGRALETAMDYTMSHGECVAVGLMLQARWGESFGYVSREDVDRLYALLCAIGLPTQLPESVSVESIMAAMSHDKKGKAGKLRFVFQRGIGDLMRFEEGAYARTVTPDQVRTFLENMR